MVNLNCCAVEKDSSKMIEILRFPLFLGVLYNMGHSSYVSKGSSEILSFTFEVKDSATGFWKSSNSIVKGTYTRLNCITDSTSSTAKIKRVNEPDPLTQSTHSRGQIFYDFGPIDCNMMGTYVCDDGDYSRRNLDLGILNCEPQLCHGESKQRTLNTTDDETTSFSLCVVAYPEINDIRVLSNSSRGTETAAVATWKIEPQTFSTYILNITLADLSKMNYGVHGFSIELLYGAQAKREMLDYTFVLQYFSRPDCPTDIRIVSRGIDNVTLTWQPGSGKGADQWFYVFITTDGLPWRVFGKTREKVKTVTGLTETEDYAFRIISGNSYMKNINEDLCTDTVSCKAEKLHSPTTATIPTTSAMSKNEDTNLFSSTAVWVAIVVVVLNIIVVSIIVCVVCHIKRGNLLKSTKNKKDAPPSGSSVTTDVSNSLMSDYTSSSGGSSSGGSSSGGSGMDAHIYDEVIEKYCKCGNVEPCSAHYYSS